MKRYVVLDFETYPVNGKSFVMEIGCVEVIDGVIGQSFHSLVRPVDKVSDFVLNLTGISAKELESAPEFIDVMVPFYNFIQNSVVVAHNAPLDRLSYESFCQFLNIEFKPFLWIDSQDIIKLADPTVQTLQLQSLLNFHQLASSTSHRAMEDAVGLAKLLIYYSNHFSIKLTRQEASFLKSSKLNSIKLLIKFLLSHFSVELNDVFSVAESPLYNVLNSDEKINNNQSIAHYNCSDDALLAALFKQSQPSLLITTSQLFKGIPYVAAPSTYVFPDKILRLYPLLTDVRVSHIEVVELYAIINWLRHTTSFQLTDLNDQLIQRYYHSVSGILDTHPLAVANFVRGILMSYFKSGQLVEFNYEMLVLLTSYAPTMLQNYAVVFHNMINLNKKVSVVNEQQLSFSTFKMISKSILNLAFIIDYLHYLNQDNLKFVQDFARLKSLIHMINEEKVQLFQKADHLVEMLSMNIFSNDKRQVLVNENVFETMEWQELLGLLNIVVHYFDEMLKLFQKISFYIFSDLNSWFSDLIYEFSEIKTKAAMFLTLPSSGRVLYIDSPIKHKPSNCTLVIKSSYQWDFYSTVLQYANGFYVHQQLYYPDFKLSTLLGFPSLDQLPNASEPSLDIQIVFNKTADFRSVIVEESKLGPLFIALPSKKHIRFWRHKLRALILSQQVDSAVSLSFYTYNDLPQVAEDTVYKIIFPEFLIPNILQPIHQSRLTQYNGSENDYIIHAFYETLHLILDDIGMIKKSSILINMDTRLEAIIPTLS